MSPDLRQRILNELHAASDQWIRGSVEHRRIAALIVDVRTAPTTPDPGGEMPEPDAGMRVTLPNGRRSLVEWAEAPSVVAAPWWVSLSDGDGCMWLPNNIREIRTPDGRVLWRAA